MQQETKNYAIVTFSCRGTRYQAAKERIDGIRLLDWIREGGIKSEEDAAALAGGLLRLLRDRALTGSDVLRGMVSPYIFVMDTQNQVRLLDLEDESNQATVRKIQTASVMRYFSPDGEESREEAEVYGFARLMRFAFESGAAGQQMGRGAKARWSRFLDRCLGKGPRRIKDFDQALKAFSPVGKSAPAAGKRTRKKSARRPLLVAACLLSAVLLFKKGVYDQAVDNHLMKREQERLVSQLQEMESSMEDLRRDHQKLEREMKNTN